MIRVLIGVLGMVIILWLLGFLRTVLTGWLRSLQGFPPGGAERAAGRGPDFPREPSRAARELKKDPQCGTYLSPELSIRSRYRGEELHFCSRECEQKFFQIQSEKSA